MGFLNDLINQVAGGIRSLTDNEEKRKKEEEANRRIFSASEFKKPIPDSEVITPTPEPVLTAKPQLATQVQIPGSNNTNIQLGTQTNQQPSSADVNETARPTHVNTQLGYAAKDGSDFIKNQIVDRIIKPDSAISMAAQGKFDQVIPAVKNTIAEGAKPQTDFYKLGERKRNGEKIDPKEEKQITDAYNESLMNMVAGSIGGESPVGTLRKTAAKDLAETVAQKGTQVIEDAATSSRRPLSTTSMGGADLPVSETARTLPFSTETVNRSPSNRYTPDMSSDAIVKSPSFQSKYQSTTAEEPYLKSVLSDAAGDRPFTTNLKDPNTAASKIVRKLKTKPDYSENSIGDLLRGNIVAKDSSDAMDILTQLKQKVNVKSVDDYITQPNEWGYQGINMNIHTPGGNVAEIQIHTPSSEAVQTALHPLYEQYRNADEVPAEVFDQARKIAADVRAKFEPSVAGASTEAATAESATTAKPTMNDPTEQATKMWEEEYQPKISKLLEDSKNAKQEDIPFIREQVQKLEDEFGGRVKDIESGKERKFITSVKEEESLMPEIRNTVEGKYKQRANEELKNTVQARIDADPQGSLEHVLSSKAADDEQVAMGIDLLRRANNAGDAVRAVDIVESLAPKLTEAGRTVQAASLLGRLTPEGALIYTQRLVNKAAKAGEKAPKISPESAAEIQGLAKEASAAKEGTREKVVAAAKLGKRIQEEVPSTLGDKLSTLQTIAQLLNPKTIIRNLGGNIGFSAMENVKDVVAAPLDATVGFFTGTRTKTLPSLKTQGKGFIQGLKTGASDAVQGIDTSAGSGKFEQAKTSAFATKSTDNIIKKSIYKPIQKLEDVTNLVLKAPDKASYQAAYDESLRQSMKAGKVTEPTEEMKQIAHMDGLYRTFQDKNVASETFSKLKSALNNIGIKGFGAGDFILKYPKTPGNILMRGIEYSPLGFLRSTIDLGYLIMGKDGTKTMLQKEFVESTSRAAVGSVGLVATGAILHQLGIITGKSGSDSDVKNLEKQNGFGDYRLNTSALIRFISSGFDKEKAKAQEGDNIMSYDWFQPQAIGYAMGADIDQNKGVNQNSLVGTILGSASSAANTIVDQPLLTGLSRLFNYGDLPGGVAETLSGAASSFTPTFFNQVKQVTDNRARDVQDPDLLKKGKNLVENKLPFIAGNVAGKYDIYGNKAETYQNGSNNIFNVFFNPAFTSKIETTPEGREAMRLFKTTGEAGHVQPTVGNSISVNGETVKLNGAQKAALQQYVGTKLKTRYDQILKNPKYDGLDDIDKQKVLSNAVSDVMMAAKIEMFGQETKKVQHKDKVKGIMKLPDPTPDIPFMRPQ